MFPGVDGFHWSPVHIVFLTLFGLVLTTVATTLTVALWRTRRDLRSTRADEIRWTLDFEDLPASERACRHALTGTAPGRVCPRGFECRGCTGHPEFQAIETGEDPGIRYGLDYPAHRFYHRGHTWVEPLTDGTLEVGVDDLATRIAGAVDRIELPKVGQSITTNGPAWTMICGNRTIRMRAPVDGEVIATGKPGDGWLLKLRPAEPTVDLRHLLRGAEVSAWLRSELDRLQMMLSPEATGATLADGGNLLSDLPAAMPEAPWEHVSSAMFLEP